MTGALFADVVVRRGTFVLDVALHVQSGETLAVLGPNGSGKSTLLAAIAGLVEPERGEVRVAERTLTNQGKRMSVPPARRRVGLLGQDPLLFPHLTAWENVAFGPVSNGSGRVAARETAFRLLEAVGLDGLEYRKPAALSGGQKQRVAIARALAAEPDVLLLDEPMAALDVETATAVRSMLASHLSGKSLTAVLVTHNVVDAIVLADSIAILHDGRIADMGEKRRVLSTPVNRFAAALVGTNLVHGVTTAAGTVRIPDGRHFQSSGGQLDVGASAAVVFAPSAIQVRTSESAVERPETPNRWMSTVAALEPAASGVRIRFANDTIVAESSPLHVVAAGIRAGSTLSLSVAADDVTVYPVEPQLHPLVLPHPSQT